MAAHRASGNHAKSTLHSVFYQRPDAKGQFKDLTNHASLNPTLLANIREGLGYEDMSPVQAASIEELLSGNDCLVQAKTGTGKTIAFLLPALNKILRTPVQERRSQKSISVLVLAPTRELAQQIHKEALALIGNQLPISARCIVGGVGNIQKEEKALASQTPDLLIATPGRLLHHLREGGLSASARETAKAVTGLQVLVMDEFDRLLDMGFVQDIQQIMSYLPSKAIQPRQTLLFSATVPKGDESSFLIALERGYIRISTMSDDEELTHERVPQSQIVAHLDDTNRVLVSLLRAHQEENRKIQVPFKAIIFLPTARQADFTQKVLETAISPRAHPGMQPILAIHSRISQSARDKVTKTFRESSTGILVSSDVVARGVDFPDVSHVFQVGLPASEEQYVHRLGRTARAGKSGEGILMIMPQEIPVIKNMLKNVSIGPHRLAREIAASATSLDALVADAVNKVPEQTRSQAYVAFLGYYKGFARKMGMSPKEIVALANEYAFKVLGCKSVPELEAKTVGKMGLRGVEGLIIMSKVQSRQLQDEKAQKSGRRPARR